eukprot:TRINITY_DN4476_c0_g1_i1.p1 TRINITY_DN4476_c0_g1~~TRINITY_DN4476_c0_g1_i1.p1  ORF type:complete len:267 (+),score=37.37 TRINITY_DN4476_c0_g1_i1:106-906(+)
MNVVKRVRKVAPLKRYKRKVNYIHRARPTAVIYRFYSNDTTTFENSNINNNATQATPILNYVIKPTSFLRTFKTIRRAYHSSSNNLDANPNPNPATPSNNSSTSNPEQAIVPVREPSRLEVYFLQIKRYFRRYGIIGVATYTGMYFATLGSMYWIFAGGLLSFEDLVGLLRHLGLSNYFDKTELNPKIGSFGLAWVFTKLTEPIRLALTLGITPYLYRLWHKRDAELPEGEDETTETINQATQLSQEEPATPTQNQSGSQPTQKQN